MHPGWHNLSLVAKREALLASGWPKWCPQRAGEAMWPLGGHKKLDQVLSLPQYSRQPSRTAEWVTVSILTWRRCPRETQRPSRSSALWAAAATIRAAATPRSPLCSPCTRCASPGSAKHQNIISAIWRRSCTNPCNLPRRITLIPDTLVMTNYGATDRKQLCQKMKG